MKIPIINSIYTNTVYRIKINKNYDSNFLYYFLNNTVENFILKNCNSIPSYNMNIWKRRLIPDLSLSDQLDIVKQMDKLH